jgi:hypothetical protein
MNTKKAPVIRGFFCVFTPPPPQQNRPLT